MREPESSALHFSLESIRRSYNDHRKLPSLIPIIPDPTSAKRVLFKRGNSTIIRHAVHLLPSHTHFTILPFYIKIMHIVNTSLSLSLLLGYPLLSRDSEQKSTKPLPAFLFLFFVLTCSTPYEYVL